MPVYLTTGTPGAGKTLWTISTVEARRLKESREVYYWGIKDLTLPWHELTMEQLLKWWELPHGSIIVIIEALDIFPKGSSTRAPPEHADRIAKHRHGGFDIYLDTQHPTKLDANVRKDVEEHRHLMRKWGSHWVTIHLFKGVRESCEKSRSGSLTSEWMHPKEAFGWYKSAEIHTVKRTLPWQVWLLLAFPAFLIYAGWWVFYGRVESLKVKEPAPASGAPLVQGQPGVRGQARPATLSEYLQERKTRLPELIHSAPRYDELTRPTVVPVIVGCWQSESGKDGWCFTQQGTRVYPPASFVVAFIKNGAFLDFEPSSGSAATASGVRRGDEPKSPAPAKPSS